MIMPNPFEDAARRAAEATDKQYASELSSLCRLTDAEIKKYFPAREDKDTLLELLKVVKAATDENEKVARLKENVDRFAGIVVKLVKILA